MIFELALRKADLAADKIWYCGDSIKADVYGAHNAGIFPVHYDNPVFDDPYKLTGEIKFPDFHYLHNR